jgi:hypothetical protein
MASLKLHCGMARGMTSHDYCIYWNEDFNMPGKNDECAVKKEECCVKGQEISDERI